MNGVVVVHSLFTITHAYLFVLVLDIIRRRQQRQQQQQPVASRSIDSWLIHTHTVYDKRIRPCHCDNSEAESKSKGKSFLAFVWMLVVTSFAELVIVVSNSLCQSHTCLIVLRLYHSYELYNVQYTHTWYVREHPEIVIITSCMGHTRTHTLQ